MTLGSNWGKPPDTRNWNRMARHLVGRGVAVGGMTVIGRGGAALVFASSARRALKITTDEGDAAHFEMVRRFRAEGLEVRGVPAVYAVHELEVAPLPGQHKHERHFAIELDRMHPRPVDVAIFARGDTKSAWRQATLGRGPVDMFPPGTVRDWLQEAGEIVRALRELGIECDQAGHPNNWGVDGEFRPMLLDLGIKRERPAPKIDLDKIPAGALAGSGEAVTYPPMSGRMYR